MEKTAFMPTRKLLPPVNAKYLARAGDKGKDVKDTYGKDKEAQNLQLRLKPSLARKVDFARGTASEFGDIVSGHPVTRIGRAAFGKEAGIGSALRTAGTGIRSRAKGLFMRGPKKMGLVNSVGYGGMLGAGAGALHGAATAQPGESRMQAAMGGAKRGAMLGAAGGLGTRHLVNKQRVKNYAMKHNLPHLLK